MICYFENKNWEADMMSRLAQQKGRAKRSKTLDLSGLGMNWGIWNHDVDQLMKPFRDLVEHVDLSHNYIDIVVIDFSKFSCLKSVDISCNALFYWGNEGTFRLAEQINSPTLEELRMRNGQAGIIHLLKTPFLHSLKRLDLSDNKFWPYSLRPDASPILRMDRFPNLEQLALRDNNYRGVPKLRYLQALKSLDLSSNPIGCNHQELLHFPQLERLDLSSTGLTRIPNVLGELRQLKTLDLRFNDIPLHAQERLQNRLPDTVLRFGKE